MSDAAPEPTQAPKDFGKETVDFVGIPIRIDGLKIKTFASGTNRWQIMISLPANDQNESLATQIARNVTKEAFAGFGFAQGALDFDQPAAYPPPPADAIVLDALNSKGDKFFPHHFVPGDGNICGSCEMVSDHAIHSEASIEARKTRDRSLGQQPPQTEELTNTSGSTGNGLADKLIRDTVELDSPEHVEPSTDAEAETQADAKAALSARSRR